MTVSAGPSSSPRTYNVQRKPIKPEYAKLYAKMNDILNLIYSYQPAILSFMVPSYIAFGHIMNSLHNGKSSTMIATNSDDAIHFCDQLAEQLNQPKQVKILLAGKEAIQQAIVDIRRNPATISGEIGAKKDNVLQS